MREPVLKLAKERPQNSGRFRKELVIELYPARQWLEKYGPSSDQRKNCMFYHKDSQYCAAGSLLKSSNADWCYRLMVNGKWYQQDGYRYSFFTEDFAYKLLKEMGNDSRNTRSA